MRNEVVVNAALVKKIRITETQPKNHKSASSPFGASHKVVKKQTKKQKGKTSCHLTVSSFILTVCCLVCYCPQQAMYYMCKKASQHKKKTKNIFMFADTAAFYLLVFLTSLIKHYLLGD